MDNTDIASQTRPELSGSDTANMAANLNQFSRMIERMIGFEARTDVQISVLNEDAKSVRTNLHDIRNQIQVLIGAEQRFTMAIQAIEQRFIAQDSKFDEIIRVIKNLTEVQNKAEGAWWILGKMLLAMMTIFSALGAAASVMYWFLTSILPKLSN